MNSHDPAVRRMIHHQLERRGIDDRRVLQAMAHVPRERFVSEDLRHEAYEDKALPTSEGQTISQPYIVAKMTELLDVQWGNRVLEVGTGSGYQTAILAYLGAEVVSIEQSRWLSRSAQEALESLGLSAQVVFLVGDGSLGWPMGAPYDRILVTAGAPHLPVTYYNQLAESGKIVIPIGDRESQTLTVFDKQKGQLTSKASIACRFVPLMGDDGWGPMEGVA